MHDDRLPDFDRWLSVKNLYLENEYQSHRVQLYGPLELDPYNFNDESDSESEIFDTNPVFTAPKVDLYDPQIENPTMEVKDQKSVNTQETVIQEEVHAKKKSSQKTPVDVYRSLGVEKKSFERPLGHYQNLMGRQELADDDHVTEENPNIVLQYSLNNHDLYPPESMPGKLQKNLGLPDSAFHTSSEIRVLFNKLKSQLFENGPVSQEITEGTSIADLINRGHIDPYEFLSIGGRGIVEDLANRLTELYKGGRKNPKLLQAINVLMTPLFSGNASSASLITDSVTPEGHDNLADSNDGKDSVRFRNYCLKLAFGLLKSPLKIKISSLSDSDASELMIIFGISDMMISFFSKSLYKTGEIYRLEFVDYDLQFESEFKEIQIYPYYGVYRYNLLIERSS